MNWRRVVEVLLQRPPAETDERSIRAKQLAEHERELVRLTAEVSVSTAETREMTEQARVGSYRRVRYGPR
jgi:hypothetical protein